MRANTVTARQHRRGTRWGGAVVSLSLALTLGGGAAAQNLSRVPRNVVLDYNYEPAHLNNVAGGSLYPVNTGYWSTFSARVSQSPPDILVVGKEAPFTHTFGPIAANGGENRVHPLLMGSLDGRFRLSAAQFKDRVKAIEHFVNQAHAGNSSTIAPAGLMDFTLPLPGNVNVVAVRAWSPDRTGPITLDYQLPQGAKPRVTVTLKQLRLYELSELDYQP